MIQSFFFFQKCVLAWIKKNKTKQKTKLGLKFDSEMRIVNFVADVFCLVAQDLMCS